jgi:hypothetical protein
VQIVNNGAAPQIQKIFAYATIAGTSPLPVPDVSQGVFDGNALAQSSPSSRRELALS